MESEDHSEPAAVAKPKRRRWQYGISTLLIAIVVLAIPLAFFANRARRQRNAVAAIERLGGIAHYNKDANEEIEWLGQWLPRDWIDEAWVVRFEGDDSGLVHMQGLPGLQWLDVHDSQITDAGLRHLQGLEPLEGLILVDTQVTVAGILHLQRLPNLRSLYLDRSQVSDAGISHLQQLPRLQELSLSCPRVTDAGLADLRKLSNLRYLSLMGSGVSAEAVAELRDDLPHCQIQY